MSLRCDRLQFAIFRILFGMYLTWHFILLIPYSTELFSHEGIFPDANVNLTFKIFPSIFWLVDSPLMTKIVVFAGVSFSIFFTLGIKRKISAVLIWYILACLFNRNILISNPSLPYVGLTLLLSTFIPFEGYSLFNKKEVTEWYFPKIIFEIAWYALAIGYTFSGLIKLSSPSWVDGTAIYHLTTNPLARPSFLRDLFLDFPAIFFKLMTWFSLIGEILFLPLSIFYRTRIIAWNWMFIMHLGILSMVSFADLTFGMLIAHLFVFDARWLKPKVQGLKILFFDGTCGFCNYSVNLISQLDNDKLIYFAPLQGKTAKDKLPAKLIDQNNLSSVVYYKESKLFTHSQAIRELLNDIGGVSRFFSWIIYLFPKTFADYIYRIIAKYRYLIIKNPICNIPTADERKKLLE